MEIEVRRDKKDKKPIKIEYDFGRNSAEAVAKFNTDGPYGDVVHELFRDAAEMQLRNFVRECAEAGHNGAVLHSKVAAWKPEIKRRGKPPLEKAMKAISGLSAEEKEALLKSLQQV